MKRSGLFFSLLVLCTATFAQVGGAQPTPLLESDEFTRMKSEYRRCVLNKGYELLKATSFEVAIEYAPVACRRGLLQIKRFMLGSAFKVEVVDGLLASVAEGVEIDLVNSLLDKMSDRDSGESN